GAAFGSIIRRDVPAMLFHDPVTDAESKSGTFADALGRVERVEDTFRIFDTRAVIRKLRADVAVLQMNANPQLAAAPSLENRIHGIIDDIEKYLLDLMPIRHHHRRFRRSFQRYLDVMALQSVVAQRQRLDQHLPNSDFITLRLALPGKRKQVLHHTVSTLSLLEQLAHVILRSIVQAF